MKHERLFDEYETAMDEEWGNIDASEMDDFEVLPAEERLLLLLIEEVVRKQQHTHPRSANA